MADAHPAPAVTSAFPMPLEEAMRTQRAIRRLKPDPVDEALALHLIELAQKAPTGSNAQNWEFVVVKDRAVKEHLRALNRMAWRLYGGLGRWLARNNPPMRPIIAAVQWQVDHFADIPVLVVACLRGHLSPFRPSWRPALRPPRFRQGRLLDPPHAPIGHPPLHVQPEAERDRPRPKAR